jgi:hypothetical protein
MKARKKPSGAVSDSTSGRRISLPAPVAAIYEAVEELEALYPGRKFTPDGHLVGSIGEVIAAQEFKLTLYPMSHEGHDAFDAAGPVQIKMTSGDNVSMYGSCVRLIVLRVFSPEGAEVVYDGPGEPVWANAGKRQKNGQRCIGLSKLRRLAAAGKPADDIFGFLAGKGKIVDVVSPALTPEEWGDFYPSPRPRRTPRRSL